MKPPAKMANQSNETPSEKSSRYKKGKLSAPLLANISPIIWLHQNASWTLINNRTAGISNRLNRGERFQQHHTIQQC